MLCEYGCGREAKYKLKNGKRCCSKYLSSCLGMRKKNRDGLKRAWADPNSTFNSDEYKKKCDMFFGSETSWNKGKTKENDERVLKQSNSLKETWQDKDSYLNSEEYRENCLRSRNEPEIKRRIALSRKYSIDDIKIKYPFFSQIEDMRYNPDKPLEEKEIQVHCKNHNCENSKEKRGWFTPTYIQLYERIRQLEKEGGNGGSYFYCSQECKDSCVLYNLKDDPFEVKDKTVFYTQEEYDLWKQTVLEQDNYQCQMCGSKENLHCHHIIPVVVESMLALDPENGIVLCEGCHYKYGHKTGTECSTGNLAQKNKKCDKS